jgi:hypothetical protein
MTAIRIIYLALAFSSLCFVIEVSAQTANQQTKRKAIVNLNNGESINCDFIKADSDVVEIEVGGVQRRIKLGEITNIIFNLKESSIKSSTTSKQQRQAKAPLLLVSLKYENTDRFIFLKGTVKNISSKPLNNITPVGIFKTTKGKTIKTDNYVIPSILPGQSIPFEIVIYYQPNIESYGVSFMYFRGSPIPHKDAEDIED